MAAHLHPGVYIEEIPSGLNPIESASTSVVALIGAANRGPLNTPVLIHSFDDYVRTFGPLVGPNDSMGLAAAAFYGNGGKDAYILRLAAPGGTKATCDLPAGDKSTALTVTALSEGAWGNDVYVRVIENVAAGTFTLTVGHMQSNAQGQSHFEPDETFADLTMTQADERYALANVNGRSALITLSAPQKPAIPADTPDPIKLDKGAATPPTDAEYRAAFGGNLKKIRDISIIVLPGKTAAQADKPIVDLAINHCQDTGNRMVIIDPPPGQVLATAADVDGLQLSTSTYAACYYPWLNVANPFPGGAINTPTIPVAPSAFAAAIWSRTDGRRGVWKAPAGVEATLLGVASPTVNVGDGEQDQLNPRGINCIRVMPGFGTVIWGARTLATRSDPEWRYVPVRRTAIMIEESIYSGIQWAVFEGNDQNLWSSLRLNVESFMNGLFRAGAFQGGKASDAYFVRCGLGDTMTQADIDVGQVIVIVGFAPLKPAEFVIVRIQQKLQQ